MKQSSTAAAELAADVKAEVDGNNNSIVPTSVAKPPPSDLDDYTDDKQVEVLNSNKSVDASSEEEHTDIEIETSKTTAEEKGTFKM